MEGGNKQTNKSRLLVHQKIRLQWFSSLLKEALSGYLFPVLYFSFLLLLNQISSAPRLLPWKVLQRQNSGTNFFTATQNTLVISGQTTPTAYSSE